MDLILSQQFKECKICGMHPANDMGFASHLKIKHNLSISQYIQKFLQIPICPYCYQRKLKIQTRPLYRKHTCGKFWMQTCGEKECISKRNSDLQNQRWKNKELRQKARKNRVNYLQKKTGKTAWQRRANNQLSYLEKWFLQNVIEKYNLTEKYDIVNQFCDFPYFLDFAFINIKLDVQLDGKCHFTHGTERIEHDIKRDEQLSKKGWKIFRIKYDENTQEMIKNFLQYLKQFQNTQKNLIENRIYKYREVCPEKKHNTLDEYYKKRREEIYQRNLPKIQFVLNSDIDFSKFGWVSKVAKILNIHTAKVHNWMLKYMPDFYQEKCFKKSNKNKKSLLTN